MTIKIKKTITITCSSLLLSSCLFNPAKYYIVESTHNVINIDSPPPDVITTPTYKKLKNKIKTIAIRAPEMCSNNNLKTNSTIETNAILSLRCGQAMSVLERQLVKNNYRVISWKVIASGSGNKTALELAKVHKAELLLQINSLDRTIDITDKFSKWTDTYYNSDSRGNKKDKATLDANQAKVILDHSLKTKERASIFSKQPGATIDVTATLVNNAESVWFYKWTKSEGSSTHNYAKTTSYIKCNKSKCWDAPHKDNTPNKTRENNLITTVSNTIDTSQYTNVNDRIYYQLLKDVIKDMVFRLKN